MSVPPLPTPPKIRNARTQALLHRETLWQIGVPLGLILAFTLVVMVWLVVGASYDSLSVMADISLMTLICPTAVMGLVILTLLAGLVYGLYYALRELPFAFKKAQDFVWLVEQYTKRYATQVAEVFLKSRASLAAGQKAVDDVRSKFDWRRKA